MKTLSVIFLFISLTGFSQRRIAGIVEERVVGMEMN
jgi:hypothetical protein